MMNCPMTSMMRRNTSRSRRKRELGLGKPLVLDFAREFLPGDFDDVSYIFSKRGAYKKFRALVIRRNVLERWYDFESKATERALREWCKDNSIEVADQSIFQHRTYHFPLSPLFAGPRRAKLAPRGLG